MKTNQTPQDTSQHERLTQVTIVEPTHPLFGRTCDLLRDFSPRGNTTITILLPNGQRRIVPRSATNLVEGTPEPPTIQNLPVISVRTILPVARLVKSKLLATKEKQHDLASSNGGTGLAEQSHGDGPPIVDAVATAGAASAEATGATVGEIDQANTTQPSSRGGA